MMTTSQVNVGNFRKPNNPAKEKDLYLCGLFISLIWDLPECSLVFRRLPGSQRQIVGQAAGIGEGLSGHASSSCA